MVNTDGGREAAGFLGSAEDCVVRSLSLTSGHSYSETYNLVKSWDTDSNPENGVELTALWNMMVELGYSFTQSTEVPETGNVMVLFTNHVSAVVEGVVMDTFDPTSSEGHKAHGYWTI